ncbi:MAG: hypothetical protein GX606_05705 [Elusimicrobia bacterium]|nr:hypothetical protein [Elusimicrobiota bacterium]
MAAKGKKKTAKRAEAGQKSGFLSDRQRKVLLLVVLVMVALVPIIDVLRCRSACLPTIKTPYPEIACGYKCPWPWQGRK